MASKAALPIPSTSREAPGPAQGAEEGGPGSSSSLPVPVRLTYTRLHQLSHKSTINTSPVLRFNAFTLEPK